MKPGDLIAAAIKPVGHDLLHLPCYDEQGDLKPDSPCGKRKQAINDFSEEVYDFFFSKIQQRKEKQNGRSN